MVSKKFRKQKNSGTTSELATLAKIVEQWKWLDTDVDDDKFIDVFWKRLSKFDGAQRKLILRLTRDFFVVDFNRIGKEFYNLFKDWFHQAVLNDGDLVICPLLAPKDFGKQKSSTSLLYIVKTGLDNAIRGLVPNHKVIFKDSPERLDYSQRHAMNLVLIDDFVGTGKNAYDAISYLDKLGWDISHIYLLSIVMMKQGKDFLSSKGYSVHTLHLCMKGITDSVKKESNDEEIMKQIENKLGVSERFQFGYGRSEALVSLRNTPNNTFPFYWWENDSYPKSPFHRGGSDDNRAIVIVSNR